MTLVILGRVSSRLSKFEIFSIKLLRWIKTHYSHCMENAGDDGILLLILSSCPKRGWTKQDNIGMVLELTLLLFQFSLNSSNFFSSNFLIHSKKNSTLFSQHFHEFLITFFFFLFTCETWKYANNYFPFEIK